MKTIFAVLILAVSFYCSAFAQSALDQSTDTENAGKASDTDVVPKADVPDVGESTPVSGDDNAEITPKENPTDDGAVPSGDYDKPSEGAPESTMGNDTDSTAPGEDTAAPAEAPTPAPAAE